jgi:hypothetical protein
VAPVANLGGARAVGGTIWCARRWDGERHVLNAASPDELADMLEDEASR